MTPEEKARIWGHEYQDFAGVEQEQYRRWRSDLVPWERQMARLLTAVLAALLLAARVV